MTDPERRLHAALARHGRLTVAVSGGVDSLTLATVAGRAGEIAVAHAVSPAVPEEATERVRSFADREGWTLQVVDAREFDDPNYLRNPLNRCYFCKSNLYARIRETTEGPIAAGTNLDDLGEYRPGLDAAAEHGVVHPFVETKITKAELRDIAARLGLTDIAALPAQPCLASRIETGIAVTARDLAFIHLIETMAQEDAPGADIRCRITANGVRLESGAKLSAGLIDEIAARCRADGRTFTGAAPYRRGAAFLTEALA